MNFSNNDNLTVHYPAYNMPAYQINKQMYIKY